MSTQKYRGRRNRVFIVCPAYWRIVVECPRWPQRLLSSRPRRAKVRKWDQSLVLGMAKMYLSVLYYVGSLARVREPDSVQPPVLVLALAHDSVHSHTSADLSLPTHGDVARTVKAKATLWPSRGSTSMERHLISDRRSTRCSQQRKFRVVSMLISPP